MAKARYLSQPGPRAKPQLFAPGLISTRGEHEFGSVFSADGLEFFYGVDVGGRTETRTVVFRDGVWGEPEVVLADAEYGFNDPFLSPDGKRLYFITDMPLDGGEGAPDHDIGYVERGVEGWSEPKDPGPSINTEFNEYYISFTSEGDMYFGSDRPGVGGEQRGFDLFVSRWADGGFQPASRLVGEVNTEHYEADVFVAPGESYVIFSSQRPDGLGRGDLYVSFRRTDGTWRPAKSLGAPINSAGHELCPFVTSDGKYLFYTSGGDIYWVAARVLEELR